MSLKNFFFKTKLTYKIYLYYNLYIRHKGFKKKSRYSQWNEDQFIIEYFKDKKSGIITIVSSIAGYRGLPNSTGYGPSKSALNNLAESLYFDFKRSNVRVCLVSPGFIKTPMTDKNDFKMPFLKTTDYAAEKIYDGFLYGIGFMGSISLFAFAFFFIGIVFILIFSFFRKKL